MIKRYDWDDGLLADDDGDLCRWEDVEKLQAERDALAAFAETRRVQINELMDEYESLKRKLAFHAPNIYGTPNREEEIEVKNG